MIDGTPPKQVIVWDSDGRALHFTEISRATEIIFGGESGVKDRLKQVVSTGEYFLRRKKGNPTYKFGSDGKLLHISDPNGNLITMAYTGGLLTQVSDNFGKAISIGYNPQGRIETVTDPKGKTVSYEYLNADLTKVTYPDRPADRLDLFSSITYAYSNHNLTDKYDSYGNLVGHWEYDNNNETDRRKIRVKTYYSHLKDSVPQKRIDLSYQFLPFDFPKTVVTRSTGATTYTIGIVEGVHVVKEIEGCSTCGGIHKSFEYSNRLDLTDVTVIDDIDQTAITTHYTYDNPTKFWEQVGEVTAKTEALKNPPVPEERTTTYTYAHRTDDPFLLTQSTESKKSVVDSQQNKVITLTYDTYGNILTRQEAGYVLINGTATARTYTTTYAYNPSVPGQLTSVDGPRTDVSDNTTFEYYANSPDQGNNRGQLKAIVNPLNQRTEFSGYDANGNVGAVTDPNGVVISYTYDERNRLKTVTKQMSGSLMQYFYDGRGNLLYIILPDPPGNRIDFSYNPADKLTEIADSLGNKIVYGYDPEGNRNREEKRDSQGVLKKYLDFAYDPYNRIWKIINPDNNYTEYSYNGRGNRTSMKDPKNNPPTTYAYDALSRLKDMNQPLSIITHYAYDTQDNQASVIDPNTNTTQYYNDDFGTKNQTTSPDTGTTKYQYDPAGNLTQKVDANETIHTYDALNRLTAIQFPSDPNQNITFTYDSLAVTNGIGRLTGRLDPSGSYTFYYDAQGNLYKEEKTISNVLYTTQYTYNKNNFMTSITYPTGRVITYTPDQAGRIFQVSTTLSGQPKTLASGIDYMHPSAASKY